MRLMVLSEEMAVESRRSALTSFVGLMNRRSAPQKVRPRPMKARIDDSYEMDTIREITPKDSRMYPIIPDGFFFCDACLDWFVFLFLFSSCLSCLIVWAPYSFQHTSPIMFQIGRSTAA